MQFKNFSLRSCYYFDYIIKDIDTNFSKILLDKKLSEYIFAYDI